MSDAAFTEIRLKGVPLCPGIALGRGCFYLHEATTSAAMTTGNPTHEKRRLAECLTWMTQRLEMLTRETEAKLGPDEADIFRAHRMILEDVYFQQRIFDIIEGTSATAENAVKSQFDRYKAQLEAADSSYLRQRVADITEIQRCLLEHLRQTSPFLRCKDMSRCEIGKCSLGNKHILIVEELTPSLAIEMDNHTVGFLVEKGGPNSHAAILSRALRMPAISGMQNLADTIPLQATILMNGDTGEVIVNPSEQTRLRYQAGLTGRNRTVQIVEPIPELKVMANIARAGDVQEALDAKAEGIGLYRTEMEALAEGRWLSEAEQADRYTQVIEAMAGKPVYIRLFDLGADKTAAWLNLPKEANPALGFRGTRLLLAHPEILRTQARALARACFEQPIHVVYPMITDLEQFQRVRAYFDASVADLKPTSLYHGVLFEVPSACLQARQILREADFACIGTNDLIQFLFATDRTNEAVAHHARPDHPALWDLIEDLAQAGEEAGKPISICGECVSIPDITRRIMKAGITSVSASAKLIAGVRRAATATC